MGYQQIEAAPAGGRIPHWPGRCYSCCYSRMFSRWNFALRSTTNLWWSTRRCRVKGRVPTALLPSYRLLWRTCWLSWQNRPACWTRRHPPARFNQRWPRQHGLPPQSLPLRRRPFSLPALVRSRARVGPRRNRHLIRWSRSPSPKPLNSPRSRRWCSATARASTWALAGCWWRWPCWWRSSRLPISRIHDRPWPALLAWGLCLASVHRSINLIKLSAEQVHHRCPRWRQDRLRGDFLPQ